jgi:thymidylate kinase
MDDLIYTSSSAIPMTGNSQELKLKLVEDLLSSFHQHGINYCHWKSNEHLDATMKGDTDMDILFSGKQNERLNIILNELGFKLFKPVKQKQYNDIEDFIGLDQPSGKIVHLHAHFRLTMGEIYLKSYQPAFEDAILDSRVFNHRLGIYCIHPAFEIILLFFREALKIRKRDIIQLRLKKSLNYSGNIQREFEWLKKRTTDNEIEAMLKNIMDNYCPILEFVKGGFNREQLLKLSVLLKKELKRYRMLSPFKAMLIRWKREVSLYLYRKSSRLSDKPLLFQRINPRGGLVIAVVGADGSGKSTVIANLQSTFRKKLDVYRLYFGKGKANGLSWQRKLLIGFKNRFSATPSRAKVPNTQIDIPRTNKASRRRNLFKWIEALMISWEKQRKLKRMVAAKNKGMLVICDRFPQNQNIGYNDGPVLNHLTSSQNPVLRLISKWEASAYVKAEMNPPDLIFKLIADPVITQMRKPSNATIEMLEAKNEGIRRLKFAKNCSVVYIDATQPLEEVLYAIKKEIWRAYP